MNSSLKLILSKLCQNNFCSSSTSPLSLSPVIVTSRRISRGIKTLTRPTELPYSSQDEIGRSSLLSLTSQSKNLHHSASCLPRSRSSIRSNQSLLASYNVHYYASKLSFHTTDQKLSPLTPDDVKKAVESLTDQFMEARELLTDARESMGTVYFSEDMEEAQEAVTATLEQYNKLLEQLTVEQKQNVLRSIGLKMEELKAQEAALKEALHDDH